MGRSLYLIGPRASGKTTLANRLASTFFGYTVLDTDLLFCEKMSSSISDFVAAHGWSRFRQEEEGILTSVAERALTTNLIVATGGGIVLEKRNRELMRSTGWVCYLKVPESVLVARLSEDPKTQLRPALGPGSVQDEVRTVLKERSSLYESCAHYVLLADRAESELCREIAEQFRQGAK
ncbi:MAG: shikimate kinase AroL [Desulfovibrio sp.]|nr:shikimate kinase AroL [Desulfovibrio sp.]